jgi:hypothetical protein
LGKVCRVGGSNSEKNRALEIGMARLVVLKTRRSQHFFERAESRDELILPKTRKEKTKQLKSDADLEVATR